MVKAPRIPDDEWESHKETIIRLFTTKGNILRDVVKIMEESHGFRATPAQYTGKLGKWGVKKYSTTEKWKYVSRRLEKRRLEGKESTTYINDNLITKKQLKKELRRYADSSSQDLLVSAPSPATPDGVDIHTPRGTTAQGIQYLHIPWFEFEALAEIQLESFYSGSFDALPTFSLPSGQIFDLDESAVTTSHQMQMPSNFWNTNTLMVPQDGDLLTVASQSFIREARSIFADIIGHKLQFGPDNANYLSEISSHLSGILIEKTEGDLERNTQKLLSPSSFHASLQLLRFAIYLSSNNLLSNENTDQLLQWITGYNQLGALKQLVRMKMPTTEIFASSLLVSAARLEDTKTVQALITLGIDVNSSMGKDVKTTALYEAVKNRDIALVKFLLQSGADPNVHYYRKTPLEAAIMNTYNAELVTILVDAGANVNLIHPGNRLDSPLVSAVMTGDPELVELLLAAGADVNIKSEGSMTVLHHAADLDCNEIVQLLLDAGADIHSGNKIHKFSAPIQYAAYYDNTEMVQILLDLGVEADGCPFSDDEGEEGNVFGFRDIYCTPLQLAVDNEEDDAVLTRLLIRAGATIDGLGYGPTPLQIAMENRNHHLAKLLLRNGANANAAPWKNQCKTALQSAVEQGNGELMQLLLLNGADINAPPALDGLTAIQEAAKGGDIKLVKELIALGANINAPPSPRWGRTCLQAAAENGDIEMMTELIKLGADVNASAADELGVTALEAAVWRQSTPAINLLIAEADNNSILSAIPQAIRRGCPEMIQGLLNRADFSRGTGLERSLVTAAEIGSVEMVLCLLNAGANVNSTSGSPAETALHAAVRGCHITVASILLDAQADVNAAYTHRRPDLESIEVIRPLAMAAEGKNIELAKLLLSKGAKVNASADSGVAELTPLEVSFQINPINDEMVRTLLGAGADVNHVRKYSSPPLTIAVRRRDIGLINLLLERGADVNGYAIRRPASTMPNHSDYQVTCIEIFARTALQAAAIDGNQRIVELLLHRGADCNAPPAEYAGVTALQATSISGNLRVVSTLLEAGAEINAPASQPFGRTALEAAAEHGRHDIVCLLLDNDRDIEGLELRCYKAARYAEAEGHHVIARRLRAQMAS